MSGATLNEQCSGICSLSESFLKSTIKMPCKIEIRSDYYIGCHSSIIS